MFLCCSKQSLCLAAGTGSPLIKLTVLSCQHDLLQLAPYGHTNGGLYTSERPGPKNATASTLSSCNMALESVNQQQGAGFGGGEGRSITSICTQHLALLLHTTSKQRAPSPTAYTQHPNSAHVPTAICLHYSHSSRHDLIAMPACLHNVHDQQTALDHRVPLSTLPRTPPVVHRSLQGILTTCVTVSQPTQGSQSTPAATCAPRVTTITTRAYQAARRSTACMLPRFLCCTPCVQRGYTKHSPRT